MKYTAEDFARIFGAMDRLTRWDDRGYPARHSATVPNGDVDTVLAALRIAERVMTEGVIALSVNPYLHSYNSADVETAIRSALTEDRP